VVEIVREFGESRRGFRRETDWRWMVVVRAVGANGAEDWRTGRMRIEYLNIESAWGSLRRWRDLP